MSVRLFITLLLVLVAVLAFFLALVATDTALSVWQRLSELPGWARYGYLGLVALFAFVSVLVAWRWLRPRRTTPAARSAGPSGDADQLRDDLVTSAQAGIDVEAALAELREQQHRRRHAEIHIAPFGEVSSGKSSLVNALLPDALTESDPRAGTTRQITHYRWAADSGDRIVITDLPGFNFDQRGDILEEARRAHLVVFVCDADLAASQFEPLERLRNLDKPVVIALNKSDRYSDEERRQLRESIRLKTGVASQDIVAITSGGREEVVRLLAGGEEQTDIRDRKADVSALRQAIQRHLDENLELMQTLQDTAVIMMAAEKLAAAQHRHRQQQSDELVTRYSRRAVVGAMAAVAPGSDLVIQGALATRLIQELCRLYEVSVKEVQIESFLKLAGSRIRNMSAITLAIAGNALKAFPGLGTLSGGLLHAVAYGMIFDSLGRAAAQTLASRGDLRPYPAARTFEELMRENLETGAARFAKLALSQKDANPPA